MQTILRQWMLEKPLDHIHGKLKGLGDTPMTRQATLELALGTAVGREVAVVMLLLA